MTETLDLIELVESTWPGALRRDLALARLYAGHQEPEVASIHYRLALAGDLPDYIAASIHSELGLLLRDRGDSSGALEAFRNAVEEQPRHHWYHLLLGRELIIADKPMEALAHFARAARIRPSQLENAWYHLLVGRAHRVAGQVDEAITAYQRALDLGSTSPEAVEWLSALQVP